MAVCGARREVPQPVEVDRAFGRVAGGPLVERLVVEHQVHQWLAGSGGGGDRRGAVRARPVVMGEPCVRRAQSGGQRVGGPLIGRPRHLTIDRPLRVLVELVLREAVVDGGDLLALGGTEPGVDADLAVLANDPDPAASVGLERSVGRAVWIDHGVPARHRLADVVGGAAGGEAGEERVVGDEPLVDPTVVEPASDDLDGVERDGAGFVCRSQVWHGRQG